MEHGERYRVTQAVGRSGKDGDARPFCEGNAGDQIQDPITAHVRRGEGLWCTRKKECTIFQECASAIVAQKGDLRLCIRDVEDVQIQVTVNISQDGLPAITTDLSDLDGRAESASPIGVHEPLQLVPVEHAEEVLVAIAIQIGCLHTGRTNEREDHLLGAELGNGGKGEQEGTEREKMA